MIRTMILFFHCPLSNFPSGKPSKTCHIRHWCKRDEEWKSMSVQKKNTKCCCIHVSDMVKGGFPHSSEKKKRYLLWFLAVSMALISYEPYFRTKLIVRSLFAMVLHPAFLQMIPSVGTSVGLSYHIDTCYAKVIQAPNILFRKSNNFDLQNELNLQFWFC